jgi:Protein of unknown function (DUF3575)
MKKIILSMVALASFGFANAQENVVKVNPLSLLGGSDLVAYELKVSEKSSVMLGAGAGGFSFGGAKYSSIGAEVQYRYYFTEALKGWYAGGQVGFESGKVTTDFSGFSINGSSISSSTNSETKYTNFKAGGKAGYQWIFGSGFTLDLNLGLAYKTYNYKSDAGSSDFSGFKASGVLPTFAFALGYAF